MANFSIVRFDNEGEDLTILETCTFEDDADAAYDHWSERYPYSYIDVLTEDQLAQSL